MWRQEAQVS
jgi:hypothetical protein